MARLNKRAAAQLDKKLARAHDFKQQKSSALANFSGLEQCSPNSPLVQPSQA
jgi:hypothetical protein